MDGVPPAPAATPPPGGVVERLLKLRDRLLATPRFQVFSLAFWPTRRVARRSAEALFDLTAGFVYAQVLQACVELDLFERLSGAPRTAADLAPELGLTPERTERLLTAAASLGLLQRRRGHYRLGQIGAAYRGVPGLGEMIAHHAVFYRDLADPVALLRGETEPELSRYWGYVGGRRTHDLASGETAPYTRLMAATQAMISSEVLAAYRFSRHRCLLDIGGGDGTFLRAVAGQAPRLRLRLFDLPSVADQATARFEEAGLGQRAEALGGDFFNDALPKGADAISLVRVLYDHDDDAALSLLRRVRAALPAGGRLIVAEPMGDTPGTPRVGDAYFGFYLLAMTHGRPRSAAALSALLRQAGFERIRIPRMRRPFLTGMIVAE
ncbi:MAG: methyltransferase [Pseudomonadota bacterium]